MKRHLYALGLTAVLLVGCGTEKPLSVTEPDHLLNITSEHLTAAGLRDEGEYYRWGEDMLLQKSEPSHQEIIRTIIERSNGNEGSLTKSTLAAQINVPKWPNGNVKYIFSGTNWTVSEKTAIQNAMNIWASHAKVSFTQVSAGGSYILSSRIL